MVFAKMVANFLQVRRRRGRPRVRYMAMCWQRSSFKMRMELMCSGMTVFFASFFFAVIIGIRTATPWTNSCDRPISYLVPGVKGAEPPPFRSSSDGRMV